MVFLEYLHHHIDIYNWRIIHLHPVSSRWLAITIGQTSLPSPSWISWTAYPLSGWRNGPLTLFPWPHIDMYNWQKPRILSIKARFLASIWFPRHIGGWPWWWPTPFGMNPSLSVDRPATEWLPSDPRAYIPDMAGSAPLFLPERKATLRRKARGFVPKLESTFLYEDSVKGKNDDIDFHILTLGPIQSMIRS